MARVEPVVGEPAAVADLGAERALLVADVHAGIEAGLRYERGVELADQADERRSHLLRLITETTPDRVVVLGDLVHRIAAPDGDEQAELEALVAAVTDRVPLTLVEGNHDAGVAAAVGPAIDVVNPRGGVLGEADATRTASHGNSIGVLHGHTWPDPALWEADVICVGHEHPQVRLEDAVGGSRMARAWLRGPLSPAAFAGSSGGTDSCEAVVTDADAHGSFTGDPPELVVFPAFNQRSGGTWINVAGDDFLAPFLPDGLVAGDAYLLDGTRLGDFRSV
jgi:metallophosphoesterase superfamily enzyme